MALEKTWRWFGFNDPISLDDLVQMGVEGVVTALHHIPNGQIWSVHEIMKVKNAIKSKGLRWSVVESLPVSEGIKINSDERSLLIENYKQSLRNLGKCGIDTVCYNFMPVLDWARTNLHFKMPNGGESLYFDYATFAAFDIFILDRPNAENDYPTDLILKAKQKFETISKEEADELTYNIIIFTQGFINGVVVGSNEDPKTVFLDYISRYNGIDKTQLRKNLKSFLDDIISTAEDSNINLCIHPDDPPFSILGLPRIISTIEDFEWLTTANSSARNGIAFCAGSLSARNDNNLVEIIEKFGHKISFVHLRNTTVLDDGSFYENGHLKGDQNMAAIVKSLLIEQKKRIQSGRKDFRMPFRPDHGIKILSDFKYQYNVGYPLIGRLKGLAEIDGLMTGIERML